MYAVSTSFLQAIREPHTAAAKVDVYRASGLVTADLDFAGGEVTVSSGTGVRRKLSLTVPDATLWDTLTVLGTELRPYRGVKFPGVAAPEYVPLGVFPVFEQTVGIGPSGAITITAPDRWAKIQRARFTTPVASVPGALVTTEIARLATAALPGIAVQNLATSTEKVGALVWERDRDKAITDLAESIGAEVFFDWTGGLIIRDAPKLSAAPIPWRIDVGANGVLIDGDRSRSQERTYNTVVVTSSNVDGSTPFEPQIVRDEDPNSPTNVATMGEIPYFFTTPLITNAAAALKAGKTMLNRVKGLAAQVNVNTFVNPALDSGDVFYVIPTPSTSERHMVDSFGVPLTPEGTQQITTVSSRPEGDVPNEE